MSDKVADPATRTIRVCSRPCSTCVIFPDDRMHLDESRRTSFIQEALDRDGYIICHQTLNGPQAMCRGFVNAHRGETFPLRLIDNLPDLVEHFDPPEK